MGLTKCMEALKGMEIVWPSAGRALELLRGSKVNLEEKELATLSNHPDRHKRSAEQSLDDSFDRGHLPNDSADFVTLPPNNYDPTTNYSSDIGVYNIEMQPGVSAVANPVPYFSSYERWPLDNVTSPAFSGTLSTSVLPQLYSTGLFDERGSSVNTRVSANVNQPGHDQNHRYPQYWNDYSAFPQLGTAYGLYDQASVPQPSPSSQMFLPDQYNMYSEYLIPVHSVVMLTWR